MSLVPLIGMTVLLIVSACLFQRENCELSEFAGLWWWWWWWLFLRVCWYFKSSCKCFCRSNPLLLWRGNATHGHTIGFSGSRLLDAVWRASNSCYIHYGTEKALSAEGRSGSGVCVAVTHTARSCHPGRGHTHEGTEEWGLGAAQQPDGMLQPDFLPGYFLRSQQAVSLLTTVLITTYCRAR